MAITLTTGSTISIGNLSAGVKEFTSISNATRPIVGLGDVVDAIAAVTSSGSTAAKAVSVSELANGQLDVTLDGNAGDNAIIAGNYIVLNGITGAASALNLAVLYVESVSGAVVTVSGVPVVGVDLSSGTFTSSTVTEFTFAYAPPKRGDYVVIRSGWGLLDDRILRAYQSEVSSVSAAATVSITFEGVDTSDSSTSKFPAGSGTGSIQKVSSWTEVTQVKSISTSGGEQQFADSTTMKDVVGKQVPTIRSAMTMSMEVFDDPTLAWYSVVQDASNARSPVPMRITPANNSNIVSNAYWSLNPVPTMNQNEVMTTQLSLSYSAEPVRYAD